MAKNARLSVAVMPSTKNRLVEFCDGTGISQGDVVDDALKSFFERKDWRHSAPDLVVDRLNTLILSVMQVNDRLQAVEDTLHRMEEQ